MKCEHCQTPIEPGRRAHFCNQVCADRARRKRLQEALLVIRLANTRSSDSCERAIARAQNLLKGNR